MIAGWHVIVFTILGGIFGAAITALWIACKEDTKTDTETDKILTINNLLLKISLMKMIIGFAPKDENGCFYTGVNGFVSDAFCRLGIESHTVDEQKLLERIELLDKKLGEL